MKSESYKEYQLKKPKIFSTIFGLSKEDFKYKFSFWANNQPHWDAIATSSDGEILYLFEAKAHLNELKSKINATDQNSIEKIKTSMKKLLMKFLNQAQTLKIGQINIINLETDLHFYII